MNHGEDEEDDVDEGEAPKPFIFLDIEQLSSGIARNTGDILFQQLFYQ